MKGVVKKPVEGAKHGGTKGFFKGLGKGFLGLVGRPTSGIADLTSTSFKLIQKFVSSLLFSSRIELNWNRVATNEEVIHRVRNARHIGRDGLVRPSIPHETLGNFIYNVCAFERRMIWIWLIWFRNWMKNIIVKMKVILHILIHQWILDLYSLQQQSIHWIHFNWMIYFCFFEKTNIIINWKYSIIEWISNWMGLSL